MADPTTNPSTSPVAARLRCLGGGAAPPEIASDLRALLDLPDGARHKLWEVLGPTLAEPVPENVEGPLTQFAQRHAAPDADLARALRACRFLLRAAAQLDLDRAGFVADLTSLAGEGDASRLAALLLPGFDRAKEHVRTELLHRTLMEQGRFVEGVDWRIEEIVSSSHCEGLKHRVALVTLHCREGDRRERITLYLGAEALEELGRLHTRLRPGKDGGAPAASPGGPLSR